MRASSFLAVVAAALLSSLTLSSSYTPPPAEGEGETAEGETAEGEGEPGEGGIGSTCFRAASMPSEQGTLLAGTPTTNGRECPTALLIDGVCSELCVNNSDCPAALPVCSDVTFAQPGREQQTIKACTAA